MKCLLNISKPTEMSSDAARLEAGFFLERQGDLLLHVQTERGNSWKYLPCSYGEYIHLAKAAVSVCSGTDTETLCPCSCRTMTANVAHHHLFHVEVCKEWAIKSFPGPKLFSGKAPLFIQLCRFVHLVLFCFHFIHFLIVLMKRIMTRICHIRVFHQVLNCLILITACISHIQ